MEINTKTIVRDIVKEHYKTARLFDDKNIDFCCKGGISLEEACRNSNVEVSELIPELEAMVTGNDPDSQFINSMELDELCDYVEKRHHAYVNDNLPFLQQKLDKVCNSHSEQYPEAFEVRDLFNEIAKDLMAHMKKEEFVLFPYIKKMVKYKKEGIELDKAFGEIKSAINQMIEEHETEGERFKKISQLTSNYAIPVKACNTFRVTYQTLKDFEQDLHRHIHLENNILFVKAIALEKELLAKA